MGKSSNDELAKMLDELQAAVNKVMPHYLAGYAKSLDHLHLNLVRVSSAEIAEALAGTLPSHPAVAIFVTEYMLEAGYRLERVDGEMKWTLYAADGEPG